MNYNNVYLILIHIITIYDHNIKIIKKKNTCSYYGTKFDVLVIWDEDPVVEGTDGNC